MGIGIKTWVSCFTCMSFELSENPDVFVNFISMHGKCEGQIYTSATSHDPLSTRKIKNGLSLLALNGLPMTEPNRGGERVYLITLASGKKMRVPKSLMMAAADAQRLRRPQRLGKLSPERTNELREKLFSNLVIAKGSDCKVWAGPTSIRLYKPDGSTEVTRSPLSVATFIAFGKPLASDKVSRSCQLMNCLNPSHLVRKESEAAQPVPSSDEDLIRQIFARLTRANTESSCLVLKPKGGSLILTSKGSDGSGQKTAVVWKATYFLAFGSLPRDDDRLSVGTTCGYLACVNPDHLRPRGRSQTVRDTVIALGHLLSPGELIGDQCIYVSDEEASQALVEIGAKNFWSFWTPFFADKTGRPIIDNRIAVAALSLRSFGWGLLPTYLGPKGLGIARCQQDQECINPTHSEEATFALANYHANRSSVLTNFVLSPKADWRSPSFKLIKKKADQHSVR